MRTLIVNARLVMAKEIVFMKQLIIEDGMIAAVIDEGKTDFCDNVIDGKGMYLTPGFIDIHAHGNSGCDIMDCDPAGLETIATYQLQTGVTSFLATTLTASKVQLRDCVKLVADYVKSQKSDVSEVLGIYVEGPYFAYAKAGAQPREHLRLPDIGELEALLAAGDGLIKVVSLAPELEGSQAAIGYLKKHRVTVALGHTTADYRVTKQAITAGASLATHLFNAMRPFDHREPGIVGAFLEDDRTMIELIADGVHLHDATIRLAVKAKGADKVILVSDQIRAAGLKDGTYRLGEDVIAVSQGVARLADGALAGSTFDLAMALKRMVKELGFGLAEAIGMVTINPAKAIGVDHILGSVAPGKQADLLLINEDLAIAHVIKKGKLII